MGINLSGSKWEGTKKSRQSLLGGNRGQVAKEKASTECGLEGEAWPPSGTPILLHHFAVMFKNKETISEVPYSVPGPQSTFPLTTFLPAEEEAAELSSKEARSCGFPLRCHPSSNAASGRCVPSRCSLPEACSQ